MKKLIHIILLALILGVFPVALSAQTTGSISGTVVDAKDNSPITGAIISLVGTKIKAGTDEHGKFVILNVESGTYSLKATYVGYERKIIDSVSVIADKESIINFHLVIGKFEVYEDPFIPYIMRRTLDPEVSGRLYEGDWFNETCRR
jgi:hypothetical protein